MASFLFYHCLTHPSPRLRRKTSENQTWCFLPAPWKTWPSQGNRETPPLPSLFSFPFLAQTVASPLANFPLSPFQQLQDPNKRTPSSSSVLLSFLCSNKTPTPSLFHGLPFISFLKRVIRGLLCSDDNAPITSFAWEACM